MKELFFSQAWMNVSSPDTNSWLLTELFCKPLSRSRGVPRELPQNQVPHVGGWNCHNAGDEINPSSGSQNLLFMDLPHAGASGY